MYIYPEYRYVLHLALRSTAGKVQWCIKALAQECTLYVKCSIIYFTEPILEIKENSCTAIEATRIEAN